MDFSLPVRRIRACTFAQTIGGAFSGQAGQIPISTSSWYTRL